MSVAVFDAWRIVGCGDRCWSRWHDPLAHQEYGRMLGRQEAIDSMWERPIRVETGNLALDGGLKRATVDGETVKLTLTELRMLWCLAARLGETVPWDDVVDAVWGVSYRQAVYPMHRHVARVNLARVRQKLGTAGALVMTVAGIGLRLEAVPPVEPQP